MKLLIQLSSRTPHGVRGLKTHSDFGNAENIDVFGVFCVLHLLKTGKISLRGYHLGTSFAGAASGYMRMTGPWGREFTAEMSWGRTLWV